MLELRTPLGERRLEGVRALLAHRLERGGQPLPAQPASDPQRVEAGPVQIDPHPPAPFFTLAPLGLRLDLARRLVERAQP